MHLRLQSVQLSQPRTTFGRPVSSLSLEGVGTAWLGQWDCLDVVLQASTRVCEGELVDAANANSQGSWSAIRHTKDGKIGTHFFKPGELKSSQNSPSAEGPRAATSGQSWRLGFGFAIGGTFLFALKSIFIKLAFLEGSNATELLTVRLVLAAPFYAGVLIYLQMKEWRATADLATLQSSAGTIDKPSHQAVTPVSLARCVSLGFLGYYLASLLDMSGLHYISAQLERLTLFTYPAMISVLAWIFLGERLGKSAWVSLGLCYAGIWLMYFQEATLVGNPQRTSWGVGLVLGSALSYSAYVVLAKPLIDEWGSLRFTSLAMLGSCFCSLIHNGVGALLVSDYEGWPSASPALWGYGLLLAFLSTVIPSFLISEAIARVGAAKTSIMGSVGPVFTMVLAVVWLGEPTTTWHIVGMMLVLAGVAFLSRRRASPSKD
ncbi:MAG: DMT family transporter [Aureliella sp.]